MEQLAQSWPFFPDVPHHTCTSITAAGFAQPIPGCVYDGHRLESGVPLGGLGTGYFTLEETGKIASARSVTTSCLRALSLPIGCRCAWASSRCRSQR